MVLYPEPCLPPYRLKSYQVETYQATLDWAPSPYGAPTDYDLEYRDLNSQNWISISNVTPPFILTVLSAHTSYAIKVKSNCAPNITQFSQPDIFTTHCIPVDYDYFSETFESMLPHNCWEMKSGYLWDTSNAVLVPTSSGWGLSTIFGPYAALARLSMFFHYWLITPPIDLGNGSDLKQLEFDLAVTDIYTSDWANLGMSPNVRFAVLISTDYGETWKLINPFQFLRV